MLFENREHAARLLARSLSAYYKNKNPLVFDPIRRDRMAEIMPICWVENWTLCWCTNWEHRVSLSSLSGPLMKPETFYCRATASILVKPILQLRSRPNSKSCESGGERYTPSRGPIDPHNRIVIVVDDGIATGSTMTAALRAIRRSKPKKLVGAVAVASPSAARAISREADSVVCLDVPAEFYAVGEFFEDFSQVSDEEVTAILQKREPKISAAS